LNALFSAPGHVPEGFRDLFASVRAEVLQRFPEMEDKVVGGFFFLRFICPALVAPEQWGLVAGTPTLPLPTPPLLLNFPFA
jgi:neurofibromin 1